ncbi:putative sulfate exporter family transporter [uncultured Erythrobacter sp.]|uniref:YeiH family protein n=1 Tax=uncultured Erythrobacter sp. TaxID=263913 RepID=UPI0026368C6D|nr:putative sulfate exporter family transporter [uncultured Erythrobacter sp.]
MKSGKSPHESYYMGDLFGELAYADEVETKPTITALVPGLLIAGIAAMAAAFLSATYSFPLMLAGLLLGFSMSFVAQDARTHAGFDFASRTLLRVGIVLLGLQVTLGQIMEMGLTPFAALIAVMVAALLGAVLFARLLGESREAGILAGGATAICGISAALALYGVIGDKRISHTQFTITLVGITIASAIALTTYPLVATWLSLSDEQAGFLTGAAIHDVAQAIGGGYAISDEAGTVAAVVKLARVALLAPLVALLALFLAAKAKGEAGAAARPRFAMPGFILLFLAVLAVNSFVPVPEQITSSGLIASKAMLLIAVISTAMRSELGLIMQAGWRTFAPVIGATLTSFAAALALAYFLI